MYKSTIEQPGQHKLETRRRRAIPYLVLGVSVCFFAGTTYFLGEEKGEGDAFETRIVGRTVDGYLADNDTYKDRRFLEIFAESNTFSFIVTTPDLTYECDGSYDYDDGRVYINEQKIACEPIEDMHYLPEPPQQV